MDRLRTLARTVETWFPWAADVKYEAQRAVRQVLGRPFEPDFLAMRLLDLGERPLLVDVGANRGQSIDAFRLLSPTARIVAFEPNPTLFQGLRRRYREDPDVVLHPVGLAEREGSFDLHLPSYNGYPFDGLASFDERAAAEWLESRILGFDPSRLRVNHVSCALRRLDAFGLEPDLVKIDVQGLEHEVLLGARETLSRWTPPILLEAPTGGIVSFLRKLGYRPHAWREGKLVREAIGDLNTFFLPDGGRARTASGPRPQEVEP